jgi:DNA-binding NarL/FixJ family response regulator
LYYFQNGATIIHLYFMAISVAIVEDLEEIRDALRSYISIDKELTLTGCFANAEEAAVALPALQPNLVVMDINLPGMSGIECIQKLKAVCASTQFMMFTVYEDDEKVFEALKAGASGYMLKKHGPQKIMEALKELYNGGSPMSADIARKVVSAFHTHDKQRDLSYQLTKREIDILNQLAKGLLYKEIAQQLFISANTVKQHIHNIYEKLHVENRTEALNKYFGGH